MKARILHENDMKSTTINRDVCNHMPSGWAHQYFVGVSVSALYA